MSEAHTPLESIEILDESERRALKEKGIVSGEDLLAIIKSYGTASSEIARLLGISETRIPAIIQEARKKVTKEFIEMLNSSIDPDQFFLGALPPEDNSQE